MTDNPLAPADLAAIMKRAEARAKDAAVDRLCADIDALNRKILEAEAEGPSAHWKVELHRQSIAEDEKALRRLA